MMATLWHAKTLRVYWKADKLS